MGVSSRQSTEIHRMANSWSNRVKFIVRYMYDYDGNGVLDRNDFECLAVRNTIMEGKGTWDTDKYTKNKDVMINLWNEISDIADFDKVALVHCTIKCFVLYFLM